MNDEPAPIGRELDLRALRYFVTAAEELHFTRAAARLFIAQQALSRDIGRLERELGTQLFVRTTRRVALTPAGERLLVRARELLALHDATWRELRPTARTYVADLLSDGRRTGLTVLEAARDAAPDIDFRGMYGGGMARAVAGLLAGEIDVGFGRAEWIGRRENAALEAEIIRFEPLAVLLPDFHALAGVDAVPLAALEGSEIDVNIDDPASPEWTDLSRQLLAFAKARPVAASPDRNRSRGGQRSPPPSGIADPHGRGHGRRSRRGSPADCRADDAVPVVDRLPPRVGGRARRRGADRGRPNYVPGGGLARPSQRMRGCRRPKARSAVVERRAVAGWPAGGIFGG